MKPVALITGGTRGIGLGIATCLAQRGFDLAVNGVREEKEILSVLGTIRTIGTIGTEVIYCQGNIAVPEDRVKIVQTVQRKFGKINVLVNNAGMAPRERRDVLEATEESFDEVLSTNLKGPYFLTQQVANLMVGWKKAGPDFQGCIINLSSVSASVASVNRGEYCISKAGISMATLLWAVRLGEFNIPVYEVRPGIIDTDMTSGVKEKYDRLIAEGLTVEKRWGTPEDVGKVVAALATGELPYATGQVIMVDGGMTLPRL
jgi:NAD(P)-dependent dehydrogenase (short-subunit alcohol dehydrogenase family)